MNSHAGGEWRAERGEFCIDLRRAAQLPQGRRPQIAQHKKKPLIVKMTWAANRDVISLVTFTHTQGPATYLPKFAQIHFRSLPVSINTALSAMYQAGN